MYNIVKKALLLGVGTAYYSKEKIEEFVKELTEKEKINPEEGKKLVDEVIARAKDITEKQQSDFQSLITKTIQSLGVATKDDIEQLKKELKK